MTPELSNPLRFESSRLDACALPAPEVINRLHSNASIGINEDRVAELRQQFGWNQLGE